ncbi:MAG: lipoyl(octanoyl) transferase LipB [Gemmataceae bacterium]|nr:lipoyl(octanoyl) transferase LipB [Gemmataceae bacterium]
MNVEPSGRPTQADTVLQVYLLGTVDFEAVLALQRRLVYEVAGDRQRAALILCEHPPLVSVGRQGSRAHILCDADELRARQWAVRWVNRGGGCWLHTPGQLAIYPVLALDQLGLTIPAYLERLHGTLLDLAADFTVTAETGADHPGIWAGGRLLAGVGIAVRDWVAYYGAVVNVNPALAPFRLVQCGGKGEAPMTSLERERRGPIRPTLVRERFVEHFTARFALEWTTFFTDHPSLGREARSDAVASHP